METSSQVPKICIESKADMLYVQELIKKDLNTRLKKLVMAKNLGPQDSKLALLLCRKWLERVFQNLSHNIEINGQKYDEVMGNEDEYEPLDQELQNELNKYTQKRDKSQLDLCVKVRVHRVNDIKRTFISALQKSLNHPCELSEVEGIDFAPVKDSIASLRAGLEGVPERAFSSLNESAQLLSEITEAQSTTHSKLLQVNDSISTRECHFNAIKNINAYRALTEAEEEYFLQPDLPGEMANLVSMPTSKLTYDPPLSLNKRYRTRLLNRRRLSGKRAQQQD